ncbi:Cytochrome b5 [Cladochytrium tenue]|nr:Cytochrome b5 [Cladochytrium tenue]
MADAKTFTWSELGEHDKRESCWMVIDGKVLDVTKFLEDHPGGEEILLENSGVDATVAFEEIGHSDDAVALLKSMTIGTLVDTAKPPKKIPPKVTPAKAASSSSSGSSFVWILVPIVAAAAIAAYVFLGSQ